MTIKKKHTKNNCIFILGNQKQRKIHTIIAVHANSATRFSVLSSLQ